MAQVNSPVLVTGGAGFIGSYLVERLLSDGTETHVLDNLSSGKPEYVRNWNKAERFKFLENDLLDSVSLSILKDYKIIYHLAANPEVRVSVTDPETHFKQNVITTFNLLENIRKSKIDRLIFTSTSTVYGDAKQIPTPENYSPLEPISAYGASKLACEALISSYAHMYGFTAIIFRLANIIGENSTHGVIYDFINKLKKDRSQLEVLGDGRQNKSYMHVSDCVEAMLFAMNHSNKRVEIFNIGSEDQVDVSTIAKVVMDEMQLNKVELKFTGGVDGGRGWKGDVKNMALDISKLRSLGWRPKYSSLQAVELTTRTMLKNNKL